MCRLLMSGIQASHSLFVCLSVFQPAKESCLHFGGLEVSTCGSTCSLFRAGIAQVKSFFPLIPFQGYRSQLSHFPPLSTQLYVFISYHFGHTEVLLPVFSNNYSSCRCIFDVFMGELSSMSYYSAIFI